MERRTFIAGSAAAGAAATAAIAGATVWRLRAAAGTALTPVTGASEEIRLGVIGVGSRGQFMMRQFLRIPGVRVTALCDIYEPRFEQGRVITGEDTPAFNDHRAMLDTAKDLHAVIVATPLSFHAEHAIASLQSGLHVYCEKAMGLTVADCDAIARTVREAGRHFVIGQQYRYAPWYRQAVERIRRGEIGRVTHIHAYWHRNYNWRRPVPDPSLERLINWRLYREYSNGLLAELGSHHIDVANWIFDEIPASVTGTGGITFYPDGRETFDNVQAIYSYPSGGTLFFSSIIGNHKAGFQIHVFGTGGTVELTLEDGTFYYEPTRPNSAVPADLAERGAYTTASLSTRGDMPYRGPGLPIRIPRRETGDPSLLASRAFIECLLSDTRPMADEIVGWNTATAVALGVEAVRNGGRVDFAERGVTTPPAAGA